MVAEHRRRLVSTVVAVSVLAMTGVLLLWQQIDDGCHEVVDAPASADACAGVPVADPIAPQGRAVTVGS